MTRYSDDDYCSVGHNKKDCKNGFIYLWIIDKDFKIHVEKTDGSYGHGDWPVWQRIRKVAASGRHDSRRKVASIVYHGFFDYEEAEAIRMIKDVLRDTFKQSKISEFNI